jgi:transporter family protein
MWQMWFFLLLTIIFWGSTPILEKIGLKSSDVFTALFIRSTAVFLVILAAFGLSGKFNDLSKLSWKTVAIFSASGIMAGLLGMWTYFKVLKLNPSSKIVPLAATYPLITAFLSVLILREGLSWPRIIGTILIVSGIMLVK